MAADISSFVGSINIQASPPTSGIEDKLLVITGFPQRSASNIGNQNLRRGLDIY